MPRPRSGSEVQVRYLGVLYSNAKEFDSSWSRGPTELLPVTVGQGVIEGFSIGITGMKVGGRREVLIPASRGLRRPGQPAQHPARTQPWSSSSTWSASPDPRHTPRGSGKQPGMTKLGYFLSSEELSPSELLNAAQLAEQAGFERVWISDHYHPWLESQGESPFVWSVIGAIAATTSLEITTAVTCPTYRIHPAVLAQATATTEAMAPGRFRFGIGSGESLNEHILGDTWPPVSVRLERLEEAVEVIRELWTGKTVTHEGKHFTVHNARLFTVPDAPAADLPVRASDRRPPSWPPAIADGWITTKPDAENLQLFKKTNSGVTQAGTKICWAPTEQEGAETALPAVGAPGPGRAGDARTCRRGRASRRSPRPTPPSRSPRACRAAPTPRRPPPRIREYVDTGFDEVFVSQMGKDQEGGIRFLAKEVLPLL